MIEKWKYLNEHLRLRLADLDSRLFEEFFLHFLRAGISLTIERHGQRVIKRVISAETYAAGQGRDQKGIDLRAVVEGGEIWVFQCKRHKTWNPSQTRDVIQKASQYQANHYFLVVACDPHEGVQDEIHKHPNWTFWNLDTICAEVRLRVHPSKHAQVLFFLLPEELKRFVRFTTEALITPEKFFERFLGAGNLFRHDWKLVGRQKELQALRDFVTSPHTIQMVTAKGGDGKSRLLWELCRTLAVEAPDTEVLCLNPHHAGDDLSFAFQGKPLCRIVLVDDAHRTEQVPLQLLALVREDSKTMISKIVLATRPQGIEALACKLYETGLANSYAPQVSLSPLKQSEVEMLATEALGEALANHAKALAKFTRDSPFLTVVAGELLRQGRLELEKLEKWASNAEFRQHVFREFEQKNLETIPEVDRNFASSLMRLLALLAPVTIGPQFAETAARCLGRVVFELETHLTRLRQSELVAGRDDALRIVPDLFADFLVYDTCYEPTKKKPGFVQQILREFTSSSAALLRNLSEATWVAHANNVADDMLLLQPLLKQERKQFEEASFYQRAEILKHWAKFSIYLPAESLKFARDAIALKTAPTDKSYRPFASFQNFYSYSYVCEQIPVLLAPIAKYHEQHRHETLDFLWELGVSRRWADTGSNQNHPWGIIAEIIKIEPKKRVSVTLDALAWLDAHLRKQEVSKALEGKARILRMLIGPCFNRVVEFKWFEGRTFHFSHQSVIVKNTQPIRDRALAILTSVIEQDSWLAVLDALSALETAIRRVAGFDTKHIKDQAKLRDEWRPERLKALALYKKAIAKHSNVAVRYEIRQTLKRDLAYEEDSSFAEEGRRVLAGISDDLALRCATALVSQGAYEFEEELSPPGTPIQYEEMKRRWNEKVRQTASELFANHPAPTLLYNFLVQLTDELVQAGHHIFATALFASLAEIAPNLAASLAEEIIGAKVETPLSREWPALLEKNIEIGTAKKTGLLQKAAQSPLADVCSAVIRSLSWQCQQDQALSEAEKTLLIQIASKAKANEAFYLFQFVEQSSDANLPWAFQILEILPVGELAPQPGMLEKVLKALVPYQERKTHVPTATIRHVLMQLVKVQELDVYHHSREWDILIKSYPRVIYELLCARIDHASTVVVYDEYLPIPHDFDGIFHISALAQESDFSAICDDLWRRALNQNDKQSYSWVKLFQAIVLDHPSFWLDRMKTDVEGASSRDSLLWSAQLLGFNGSLIIFRFPELTRLFLKCAQAFGEETLYKEMRAGLYSGCGPQSRSYYGGTLNKELDYVEAEAAKAAEAHAADELLGPFYRWIVGVEQKERLMRKMQAEADMASLD